MRSPRRAPSNLEGVHLGWYPLALVPILGLLAAPFLGWLPPLALPFGLFFLFFWIFSFGFAVYGKTRKTREPRQ